MSKTPYDYNPYEHAMPVGEPLKYEEVRDRIMAWDEGLNKPLAYTDPQSKLAKREGYPDDNPKTAIGATKVPLHLVPPAGIHHTALAFADGARKYGPYNWRDKTVSTSVYYGAALRHLTAFWDGEDVSPDAGVQHLGHVMACCAIILDAMSIGKLNDDRPTKGAAGKLQAEFSNGK